MTNKHVWHDTTQLSCTVKLPKWWSWVMQQQSKTKMWVWETQQCKHSFMTMDTDSHCNIREDASGWQHPGIPSMRLLAVAVAEVDGVHCTDNCSHSWPQTFCSWPETSAADVAHAHKDHTNCPVVQMKPLQCQSGMDFVQCDFQASSNVWW